MAGLPPLAPPPRHTVRRRRVGRKRRPALTTQQIALLVCMVLAIGFAGLMIGAGNSMQAQLAAKRQQEAKDYADLVARHTVRYEDWIRKYASYYDVHPAFVAAVILRESSYDAQAVSRVEARGLMQLMPDTGEWVAGKLKMKDYTWDTLFDAETNIQMGCWYLGYLSDLFAGDPIVVACAYHAGQGNVRSWLTKYSTDGKTLTIDQIPMDDTKSYARKVLNAYAIYLQNYYTY